MKYIVNGWNEFYDGWLGFIFGQERPEGDAAGEGWDMANESSPKDPFGGPSRNLLQAALAEEIKRGDHVQVEVVDGE